MEQMKSGHEAKENVDCYGNMAGRKIARPSLSFSDISFVLKYEKLIKLKLRVTR